MIKQDFHIAGLIAKYVSGELTAEENAELEEWRKGSAAHEALFQKMCDESHLRRLTQRSSSFNSDEGWKKVEKRIHAGQRRRIRTRLLSYAAAIMLPLLLAGIFTRFVYPSLFTEENIITAQAIQPGSPRATLTLADGQTLSLNSHTDEILEQADGSHVRIDSTQLDYRTTEKHSGNTLIYNKVETPRGGEYSLLLSDGTKVHLSAMSSLRFPTAFGDGGREVELEGEAFFEVTQTGQPFTVQVNGMQVEVLGTIFNISAYPEEEYQTTLVSGSVKVNSDNGESCVLAPSQQAALTPGEQGMEVRTVNVTFYTSWTKGKIHFKDQRLEDIMTVLSRWYDMEVVYADEETKNILFGCHVDRYTEITPFVHLLEETGKVHVKINDKKIIFSTK